jgi:hypothetical protein
VGQAPCAASWPEWRSRWKLRSWLRGSWRLPHQEEGDAPRARGERRASSHRDQLWQGACLRSLRLVVRHDDPAFAHVVVLVIVPVVHDLEAIPALGEERLAQDDGRIAAHPVRALPLQGRRPAQRLFEAVGIVCLPYKLARITLLLFSK